MDKRGISSMITNVTLILIVVVSIVIIGALALNLAGKADSSIKISECNSMYPDSENRGEGYYDCLVKNFGEERASEIYDVSESEVLTFDNLEEYENELSSSLTEKYSNMKLIARDLPFIPIESSEDEIRSIVSSDAFERTIRVASVAIIDNSNVINVDGINYIKADIKDGGVSQGDSYIEEGSLSNINVELEFINETKKTCVSIKDGLVALYCFDYDTLDSSGNNNHAESFSDINYINDGKKIFADFNGNDYAVANASESLMIQNYSISYWIKNKNNSNYCQVPIYKIYREENGMLAIRWQSQANCSYYIEGKGELDLVWQEVESYTGNGSVLQYLFSPVAKVSQYYRVKLYERDSEVIVSKGVANSGYDKAALYSADFVVEQQNKAGVLTNTLYADDTRNYASSSSSIDEDWHNVVYTKDDSSLKMYFDNVLVYESSSVIPSVVVLRNMSIGAIYDPAKGKMVKLLDAKIDNLAIYNRTLSREEVNYSYNEALDSYYNFNYAVASAEVFSSLSESDKRNALKELEDIYEKYRDKIEDKSEEENPSDINAYFRNSWDGYTGFYTDQLKLKEKYGIITEEELNQILSVYSDIWESERETLFSSYPTITGNAVVTNTVCPQGPYSAHNPSYPGFDNYGNPLGPTIFSETVLDEDKYYDDQGQLIDTNCLIRKVTSQSKYRETNYITEDLGDIYEINHIDLIPLENKIDAVALDNGHSREIYPWTENNPPWAIVPITTTNIYVSEMDKALPTPDYTFYPPACVATKQVYNLNDYSSELRPAKELELSSAGFTIENDFAKYVTIRQSSPNSIRAGMKVTPGGFFENTLSPEEKVKFVDHNAGHFALQGGITLSDALGIEVDSMMANLQNTIAAKTSAGTIVTTKSLDLNLIISPSKCGIGTKFEGGEANVYFNMQNQEMRVDVDGSLGNNWKFKIRAEAELGGGKNAEGYSIGLRLTRPLP